MRVTNFDDFKNYLIDRKPDIIISDYRLPGYTVMDVLEYIKKEKRFNYIHLFTALTINTTLSVASG